MNRQTLLSYQPFSLFGPGGTGRIFRRLYEGHFEDIGSIGLTTTRVPGRRTGAFFEENVLMHPVHQKWHRSYLRSFVAWVRDSLLHPYTQRRIQECAARHTWSILHTHAHGPYADALIGLARERGAWNWISFHDHYEAVLNPVAQCRRLWEGADRRFVISDRLGKLYADEFGDLPWEVITDGLHKHEIMVPMASCGERVNVYFAGLLHIDYYECFEALADALDILCEGGMVVCARLRGTQHLRCMERRRFRVEYLPFTLNEPDLETERNAANILYLPMKFGNAKFSQYSLSTKMVGYLGAPGAIFYHGPRGACVAEKLERWQAAQICDSFEPREVAAKLLTTIKNGVDFSSAAKSMAASEFMLANQQVKFWGNDAKVVEPAPGG